MEYMDQATKLHLNNSEVWNSLCPKEIHKTTEPHHSPRLAELF